MEEKNKVYKWLNNWGLLIVSIIIIIVYTVLNSGIITEQELNKNVWTNILFTIINMLAAFYIARKVSLWGWLTDMTNNQKKIAKTAIRHNRGNLASILKLIKITKDKVDKVDDELIKQYIKEIQNHLEMIYNGLQNSEADFREIVNEELKEQNALEIEISDLFNEIEQKTKIIRELSESHDEKEDEITALKKQLKKAEKELNTKISSLPFGLNSFSSGSTINLEDNSNFKIIGKIDLDNLNNLKGNKKGK